MVGLVHFLDASGGRMQRAAPRASMLIRIGRCTQRWGDPLSKLSLGASVSTPKIKKDGQQCSGPDRAPQSMKNQGIGDSGPRTAAAYCAPLATVAEEPLYGKLIAKSSSAGFTFHLVAPLVGRSVNAHRIRAGCPGCQGIAAGLSIKSALGTWFEEKHSRPDWNGAAD